jgi:transposase
VPLAITDPEGHHVTDAFECCEILTGQAPVGESLTWLERRLVVRSPSQAEAATERLEQRLRAAEAQLAQLNLPGRGKKRDQDRPAFQARVAAILKRHYVEDLLAVDCREQIDERPVRAYGLRPARIEQRCRFEVRFERCEATLAEHVARLGWRVYATNHEGLSLWQAVRAYRSQYVLERSFGCLKGQPLSLVPMYLQREDHATGLVRLLSLALRVLILLEFVVRRQLAVEEATLAGLYAGNPKRATRCPTAERLLEAFEEVTLTVVVLTGVRHDHLTALQERILSLLGFSVEIYTRLCHEFAKPP